MEWLSRALTVGWVDLAMLGVVFVSAIVGVLRGFVFEVLSLAGWIAAWLGAFWLGPVLAPHLPFGAAESALNLIVAFVCAFLLVAVLCGVVARLVRALVAATPLRPVDRVLGAVFGVLRGLLILLVVAAIVGWTPPARASNAWRESHGAAWLTALLNDIVFPLIWPTSTPPIDRQRV